MTHRFEREINRVARATRTGLFGTRAGLGGPIDDAKAAWDAKIREFQDARNALATAEMQLYDVRASITDSEDAAEWQRLLDKVIGQQTAMDAVAGAVSTAADWFNSATDWIPGLSGKNGLAGTLGIALPALPISLAALVGLIAAAVAIVGSVGAFLSYLASKNRIMNDSTDYVTDRTEQLIDAGVDPQAASTQAFNEAREFASNAAKDQSNYSFGASAEKIAMWIGIAAASAFVLPKLLDMIPKKR